VQYALVHELFFDLLPLLQAGHLPSRKPVAQDMTGGKVKLLIADHSEDNMANIRKYRALEKNAKG
jgi:hypothetical protein